MTTKLDILVFAVHPDDAELGCSGTILKHISQGKKVGIIDLTQGELGTRGSAELRLIEAQNAAKILGLTIRENLGFRDGFFKNDETHQLALIQKIRQYQPDIILCNAPEDRHPDHGRASSLTFEACFYSGLAKINSLDSNGLSQNPWRPKQLFHYIQDKHLKPSFIIDVTPFWDKKKEAILAFKSQFFDPTSSEPQSYISSEDFWHFLEARSREMGHPAGFTHAEGFIASKTYGVNSLFDII